MPRNYDHKDDIPIGPDQWITYLDISGQQHQAEEIDGIIEKANKFWNRLETHCVAACCGIDAFDLYPQAILEAGKAVEEPNLRSLIIGMIAEIRFIESNVLVSTRLNNYFHKQVFLQVLEHIVNTLDG